MLDLKKYTYSSSFSNDFERREHRKAINKKVRDDEEIIKKAAFEIYPTFRKIEIYYLNLLSLLEELGYSNDEDQNGLVLFKSERASDYGITEEV